MWGFGIVKMFLKDHIKYDNMDIRKIGQKVTGRVGAYPEMFTLEIQLNASPPQKWIECFKNPRQFTILHTMKVEGNKIITACEEKNIEFVIGWVNRYIEQANKAYTELLEKESGEEKKCKEREESEKREIEEINKRVEML